MEAEVIKDFLFSLFALAGTVVAAFLTWFLKEKVGAEKVRKINETLEKIQQEFFLTETWVKEAVRYAQQRFINEPGSKKFDAVMEFVGKKAQEYGIELSRRELEVLIESQVNKLKQELQDTWVGIVDDSKEKEAPTKGINTGSYSMNTQNVPQESNVLQFSALRNQDMISLGTNQKAEVLKQTILFTTSLPETDEEVIEGPQDGSDLKIMGNESLLSDDELMEEENPEGDNRM